MPEFVSHTGNPWKLAGLSMRQSFFSHSLWIRHSLYSYPMNTIIKPSKQAPFTAEIVCSILAMESCADLCEVLTWRGTHMTRYSHDIENSWWNPTLLQFVYLLCYELCLQTFSSFCRLPQEWIAVTCSWMPAKILQILGLHHALMVPTAEYTCNNTVYINNL
jgi:hypothetical protein